MPVHSPPTLTSMVMARLIRPVTILLADIGPESPRACNMAQPSTMVPTGARVESQDTPTSGMMPLTAKPLVPTTLTSTATVSTTSSAPSVAAIGSSPIDHLFSEPDLQYLYSLYLIVLSFSL